MSEIKAMNHDYCHDFSPQWNLDGKLKFYMEETHGCFSYLCKELLSHASLEAMCLAQQ